MTAGRWQALFRLGIFIVGSWEFLTRLGCYGPDSGTCAVDPFFFGQPSGIWSQLVRWVQVGTAQGPLWEQILTTLGETGLGSAVGVIPGLLLGVALGRHPRRIRRRAGADGGGHRGGLIRGVRALGRRAGLGRSKAPSGIIGIAGGVGGRRRNNT